MDMEHSDSVRRSWMWIRRYGSLRGRTSQPHTSKCRGKRTREGSFQQILGYTHCEQKVLALPVHGQLVLPAIQNQLAAIIKRQEFTPTEDAGFSKCAQRLAPVL